MTFVINGAEWRFDGWSNVDIQNAIEKVLARIDIAIGRNEKVLIGDDFHCRHMLGDLDLWSINSSILSPEIKQELAAWLGRCSYYADEVWPVGMEDALDISIDNGPNHENADLAWAHHNVRNGCAVACIGVGRIGVHKTSSSLGDASIHWVLDETSNRQFWRQAIDVERDTERTLQRLSPHAFPDLHFHEGVWEGLKDLSHGYLPLRFEIRRYLAILDDYGHWAFTSPPPALSPTEVVADGSDTQPTNQIVQKRFAGFGLTITPEKADVRADKNLREAREIVIATRTFYCEWHGKLEPHRNRLHIHGPAAESNQKVIIAIFHEHL